MSSVIKDYVGGYVSGVAAIIVSHPIDTIKTNYQENIKIKKYTISQLYKGIRAPIIGIGLEKAIVFGTYNTIYKQCNNHTISGAISGLAASFIVTPYERIKILLQTNNKTVGHFNNNVSGFTCFASETKYIKYLFQGLSATFYREVPGFAIYFTVYNKLKDYNISKMGDISCLSSFMYGGIAGATSWLFIYPQDRIKTHMQSSVNQITLRKAVNDILLDGGIRGLYKGFHLALLRAIPLHATAFMVNELFNKCID